MDVRKRTAAITDFKAPSRCPKVLVVSLKAGGVGLNVCARYFRRNTSTYHDLANNG
jgi:SNF2 family DNA or RNA helicase